MSSEADITGSAHIFIAYAHKDERLLQQLYQYLDAAMSEEMIYLGDDQKLRVDHKSYEDLIKNFNEATIILCMISNDFILSDYRDLFQTQGIPEKEKSGRVIIIPVLLRPTNWMNTFFASFQSIPRLGKTIIAYRQKEQIFTDISNEVAKIAKSFSLR